MELDWRAFLAGHGAKRVALPSYPFQRQRYWLESTSVPADAGAVGLAAVEHPLLSAAIEDPEGRGVTLSGRVSLQSRPWLAEHVAAGAVLFPATAFLELALSAAERLGAEQVGRVGARVASDLARASAVQLRVVIVEPEQGDWQIAIYSRPGGH